MNNVEKEYLYLKSFFGDGEKDALRDIKHGGFMSVEEKEGDLIYTDKYGKFAVISVVRMRRLLALDGELDDAEYLKSFSSEAMQSATAESVFSFDKEEIVRDWKPFYDYLKRLRKMIAADKNFSLKRIGLE